MLTLAEADAELQRLAILRRTTPTSSTSPAAASASCPTPSPGWTQRVADLTADLATLPPMPSDPLTIGGRPYAATTPLAVLGRRLDALPEKVRETSRFPLGRYRGLAFGMVLHPVGAADVYLEGPSPATRMLSREHRGPRAVLNALDRLAGSYAASATPPARTWRSPKASSATTRPASAALRP